MHDTSDLSCVYLSSVPAHNSAQDLDAIYSALAWNANTSAIFALEKNDLPLVDTSIALEAACENVVFLVTVNLIIVDLEIFA